MAVTFEADPRDPVAQTHGRAFRCRYECGAPVTHYCEECASGASGLSAYFCEFHAKRHDSIVRQSGGSVFCVTLLMAGKVEGFFRG